MPAGGIDAFQAREIADHQEQPVEGGDSAQQRQLLLGGDIGRHRRLAQPADGLAHALGFLERLAEAALQVTGEL
ncbi:MAG: hypothetical protein B7Z45_09420, partial [Azorhizobium sp. 12-66-6]